MSELNYEVPPYTKFKEFSGPDVITTVIMDDEIHEFYVSKVMHDAVQLLNKGLAEEL